MPKLARFVEAWRHENRMRAPWFNAKWRLLVVLLLVSSVLFIRDYLEGKYIAEFAATPVPVYLVLDKVMYWLLVGVVLGGAAVSLMFEGEFAIGLWKSMVHFEKQVGREFGRALGGRKKKRAKRE